MRPVSTRYSRLAVLAALISPCSVQAQQAVPTDKNGEEVFGAGYLPEPPSTDAVPLKPGRPGAGVQIPDSMLESAEGLFTARFGERPSVRPEKDVLRQLPMRRKFRRQNSFPGYKAMSAAQPFEALTAAAAATSMKVHFVNVGQGSGAIIEFPCGVAVVDTGGEYATGPGTVKGGELFEAYLDKFFDDRPNLHRTIDVLFSSHPHQDHIAGLELISGKAGADAYKVNNVVDNGQQGTGGSLAKQTKFKNWVVSNGGKYSAVTVDAIGSATGATNDVIDPFPMCKGVDPKITALWGADFEHLKPPHKQGDPWLNPNNHSVVLRIEFGSASMMFVGDLQTQAEKVMLDDYKDNKQIFNTGLYLVSHHGAESSHTKKFVEEISPQIAVVSMGTLASHAEATAWDYGHPRKKVIDDLQAGSAAVSTQRHSQMFNIASGVGTFQKGPVTKAIFGTGWEGTVIVEANSNGSFQVVSGQN